MAQSIVMPSFGMYTSEGKLVTWLKPSGSRVEAGQIIAEIETEKAVQELPAIATGVLHQVAPVGTVLKEQDLLGYILENGEAPPSGDASASGSGTSNASASESPKQETRAAGSSDAVKASPIAKRLAKEHGIDLTTITGTGPGGRIVEADVNTAVEKKKSAPATPAATPPAATVSPSGAKCRRAPFGGMRRTIAERLRASVNAAVSLTLTREVEADKLVAARAAANIGRSDSIPFDAYFAKLLAAALRDHPALNATIEGDELVSFDEVNVGVAVSLPDGLTVPVVRNVDALSLAEVGARIRELASRARSSGLRAPDMAEGTCTITNLGASGVDAFTPILNPPQSCILGIGRIRPRAVPRDGAIVIAQTCVLSLTFDHRICDGAPAALVLDAIAQRMNDDAWLAGLAKES